MGRDETYWRLDKMMGGYLVPVHFCPASIPQVHFNVCVAMQFSCLDPGALAVPYPMYALVLCILLVDTVHSLGKNLAWKVPMHNEAILM